MAFALGVPPSGPRLDSYTLRKYRAPGPGSVNADRSGAVDDDWTVRFESENLPSNDVATPTLKQFGDLTPSDFETHPVWVSVHLADYEEPWYDDTDEETFRPARAGEVADPARGIFLVRATATLRDGTRLPAFITPALEAGDLGTMQPNVFAGGGRHAFWGGMFGVPQDKQEAFFTAVQKGPDQVFPLRVDAEPDLAGGVTTADVRGFAKLGG